MRLPHEEGWRCFESSRATQSPALIAVARWYSNFELENDSAIEAKLQSMGAPGTLAMGRKNVVEQFRY